MKISIALIAALALTTPLAATANTGASTNDARLASSVQQRLDRIGLRDVDATTLTNRQLSMIHLELQGKALDFGGFNRINARSAVRVILEKHGASD